MTEPSLALQMAIRARLVASPHVMELVEPPNIRDGGTRPEAFPSIILGSAQVETAGHYRTYRNVTVYLDLHIWGETLEATKNVGAAVSKALFGEPDVPGFDLTNGLSVERSIYMTDPSACGHGVVSLRALMGGAI
ncbi:hypothetical protein GCM10007989_33620 [Devosia pacifica]|uniref:DUF3168 domain-containing protein n=1 Tax=Devosia pacifica TaxID=1335967 RepID=A0A918VYL0_9HYPH|nr:DUF3168 domain-containing protein [Devosia pacifica]GHA34985.1 hypothetical protein GCM10007989_33620 [Devosia pacifica]